MKRKTASRILVVALVAVLALLETACRARVGVGVSIPIGGGWRGPYGGVSMSVGIPIR
jgi:predicted small secreted protein